MKLKGINPFEQYVDKAVVGVIGTAALGVLAWQFVSQPKITIGNKTVTLDRAYEPVKDEADALIAKVTSPNPKLPDAKPISLLSDFTAKLSGSAAPRREIAAMGANIVFGGGDAGAGVSGDAAIAALSIPAPGAAQAAAYAGSIDPLEIINAPEIKTTLLPESKQPYDLFSVSIEANFDGVELEKALRADPDGEAGPARAVPLGWWRGVTEIVAVEVERQQQRDDGTWTDAVLIGSMPGRFDAQAQAAKVKSAGDAPAWVELARSRQNDILRPDFYTLIAGSWQPPSEAGFGKTPTDQLDAKQKKLNGVLEQIEAMRKRMAAAGNRASQQANTGESAHGAGQTGKGGGQVDPRLQDRGGSNQRQTKPTQPSPIEKKLAQLEADRDRLAAEIEELRQRIEKPAGQPNPNEKALTLLENPKVKMWAHDVRVEPGATYRYRLRVAINSPFFGREASLTAEQRSLAKDRVMHGAWSEWTAPVSVDSKKYFFVTAANDRDASSLDRTAVSFSDRATVEIYEFYYGYFRKGTAGSLQPGDPLIATAKLPADLQTFDETKLAAGAPRDQPQDIDQPRGHGAAPVDPRLAQPGQQDPSAIESAAVKLTAQTREVTANAVLLDVAAGPQKSGIGGARTTTRAYLRDGAGKIVVMSPDQVEGDAIYQRVAASAKAGENQGKPKVTPRVPTAPTNFPLPTRGADEPKGPSGG